MKTRGTMDGTFFDYFWIMKRREIFFQVHVTNVSYTVEKRKILKTSHRERDPIPPNNLLRKLSHFFHPPKFHTFQYLHYEPPPSVPRTTPRGDEETMDKYESLLRATMSQHLGPETELWPLSRSAFSIRVRPGRTISRRFPLVSFPISADYTPWHTEQHQAPGVRSPFPRIDFQRNRSFLFFFSSFLSFSFFHPR